MSAPSKGGTCPPATHAARAVASVDSAVRWGSMSSMFHSFLEAIKGLLGSKKFIATVAGLVAVRLCSRVGCDPEAAKQVLLATIGFVAAQGLADFGKHAKK